MNKIFTAIIVISFTMISSLNIYSNTSIKWLNNFEQALSIAKSENKPIMLFIHTTWCGWCREYENVTFKDKDIIKEAQNFVPVEIDAEKDAEGTSLRSRYNIRAYPTVLFLDPSDNILDGREYKLRIDGYLQPHIFIQPMKEALK